MNNKPLVSVIVNCFNGKNFVNRCIESILRQTYQNFEIVFWDNKSKDSTLSIIKNYNDKRIKIYSSNFHTNISVARNNAIKKSVGKYVCFLDIDDYWREDKLEKQLISFNDNNIGFSFTNFWYIENIENTIRKKKINLNFEIGLINKIIKKYEIVLSTIMLRRSLLIKLKKPFNEKYHIVSDFDFTLKLVEKTKFIHVHDHLTYRTWHGNNETINKRELGIIELENWIKNNKRYFSNYSEEMQYLENNNLYDRINLKIKKRQIISAIMIFTKLKMFNKLNYLKKLFLRIFKKND